MLAPKCPSRSKAKRQPVAMSGNTIFGFVMVIDVGVLRLLKLVPRLLRGSPLKLVFVRPQVFEHGGIAAHVDAVMRVDQILVAGLDLVAANASPLKKRSNHGRGSFVSATVSFAGSCRK